MQAGVRWRLGQAGKMGQVMQAGVRWRLGQVMQAGVRWRLGQAARGAVACAAPQVSCSTHLNDAGELIGAAGSPQPLLVATLPSARLPAHTVRCPRRRPARQG